MLPRSAAITLAIAASAPGRSGTSTRSRTILPDRASARDSTDASTRASMLPPLAITATVLPRNRSGYCSTAASAAAPAPSTTDFSISTYSAIASSMRCSDAVTMSSTSSRDHRAGERAGLRDRDPLRDGRSVGRRAGLPEGVEHPRVALGLDADDVGSRRSLLHRDRDAGDQPAAADRHDDDVGLREYVEELESDGSLAGDDPRVVERGHQRRTGLLGDRLRVPERRVVVVALELDVRAVVRGVRHLRERRVGRHHDRRRDVEQLGVVGDALRVVPGRRGDHAVGPRFDVEVHEEVARPALLEGARELQVLPLDPDVGAGDLRERPRVRRRRHDHRVADRLGRRLHVGEAHGENHPGMVPRPARGVGLLAR